MENTEDEIIQLQTKISYLEDFLNQIQEVCVDNTKEIQKLKEENHLMAQKIKDMSDQLEGDIPNRKPPHY